MKIYHLKTTVWRAVPRAIVYAIVFVIVFAIVIISTLSMYSCTTSRISNHVSRTEIDTLYQTNRHYDSIYIYSSSEIDRTRDTLTITKTMTEYRYNLVRDTIFKSCIDSIPYEVVVYKDPITHKPSTINRMRTWFDHLTRATFFFLLGAVIILLYRSIRKFC